MIQNEFMFCSKIVSTSLERFVTPFVTPSVNLVGCYNLPAAWRGVYIQLSIFIVYSL